MKVDQPRSNHISQTFHIDHLIEEDKKSDSYEGSDSNKIESSCSEDDMISEGSENEINENESQQEVSPRLKQMKIREKQRSYYDAGISAAEVITKDIPGLIPTKIYNHYKLFNEKMTNSRKKRSGRKSIITKDIGLKIENLIKEDDLLNLEDIKKVLEKSNDIILSKRTIERYLKKKGYTHDMPLEKHELTQKQKEDRLKF